MICMENVSKKYGRSIRRAMFYGLQDIGRNILGLSSHAERLRPDEFWAVEDVSFDIKRGETLGLIGPNGSGKTTIMKMLNGIFWPDTGKITMRGRVGALIAVGSGFHPVLTGRENIYVNGAILGMGRREMQKKFDSIVAFADIGNFLDMPVKHYSSGMYVRLGFAIAIHCEPDILLVDEILAVGDIDFRAKCVEKMKALEKKGITKIFVSHDMNSVYLLCNQTMYLSAGKVKHYGPTADVIGEYKKDMDALMQSQRPSLTSARVLTGTQEVVIEEVGFLDGHGNATQSFRQGERLRIHIRLETKNSAVRARVSILLYNDWDVLLVKETILAGCSRSLEFLVESLSLNIGRYALSVECTDLSGKTVFDRHEKCYEIIVEQGVIGGKIHERGGLIYVPCRWDVSSQSGTLTVPAG